MSGSLLRQPHGFEGFLLGLEERERGRLAASDRDQPGASGLNLDTVSAAQVSDILGDQDPVLDLHEVQQLDPEVVECLPELLGERPDIGVTPVRALPVRGS